MKNLFKPICLFSIVIIFNLASFSQQQFGIKVSGGISRIYGQLETSFYPEPPMITSFSPSFQAGVFYLLPTGNKTSFGAELVFSKVQGAQTFKWYNNHTVDFISNTTYEHVSWLTLPVYYGITFNRLTLNAGFQISHALSASKEDKAYYMLNGEKQELNYPQSTNFNVNNFDFGPRAGIIYQLNNRLSVEGMFYYGFNNIKYSKLTNEELKVQQMTVGLRYALKDKQADNLTSFANQQFGVKLSGGLSQITNSLNIKTLTTQLVPSGQGGFYYNRIMGNESSLGAELLFTQIEGMQKSDVILSPDQEVGIVFAKNNFYSHISYLSLPVYYGININKLTIHAGAQISYAIATGSRSESTGIWHDQPYHKETTSDHMDIDKFDFGPRAGMIYLLNDKLSVEAAYYYGFNNIDKGGSAAYKLKVQQMTLGIRYALWNKSKTQ